MIRHLQIDTLPTQKLELTYHELSCSRLERQIFNFLNKLAVRFMNLKANLLKKSQKWQISFTVVNVKHQNDTKMGSICYAGLCGKKPGQKWPFSTSVKWCDLLVG